MPSVPQVTSSAIDEWRLWLPENILWQSKTKEIALLDFNQTLEDVADKAKKPYLGWLVGCRCTNLSKSMIGRIVLGSKTLGTGLHWLCHFFPLLQDATQVKLEIHDETAKLSYKILDPKVWPREQDALFTLSIFANFIRAAGNDIWSHVHVNLEAPKTEKNSDLYRYLHAHVNFDCHANEIVFPSHFLHKPLAKSEQIPQIEISKLTRTLSKRNREMSICDRVRYVVYEAIFETTISQDFVAKELGCSTRTLRRKLSSEGESYQSLLDICKMEVAAREIATTKHISFSQMALKLGYSEHSTFTRAFGRWAGMSPRQYRTIHSQSHRQNPFQEH